MDLEKAKTDYMNEIAKRIKNLQGCFDEREYWEKYRTVEKSIKYSQDMFGEDFRELLNRFFTPLLKEQGILRTEDNLNNLFEVKYH